MASIPDYRRQVLPGALPGPQMPTNADPRQFGAGVGQLQAAMGLQIQMDRDKRAAYERVRQARLDADEVWTGKDGGRWKAGESYFEWSKETAQPFLQQMPVRLEGLSPGARALAEPLMDEIADTLDGRVKGQAGQAHAQMVSGALASDIESISSSARLSATDPAEGMAGLTAGLDEGATRIREYANDHPYLIGDQPVEQWVSKEVGNYESELVADAIDDALKAGQPQLAESYKQTFGHKLKPDALAKVQNSLQTNTDLAQVARVYEFMEQGLPIIVGDDGKIEAEARGGFYRPPVAQIEQWLKNVRAIGRRQGWSQEQIEKAVTYTSQRAAADLELQRAKQDEVTESIAADLGAANGDLLAVQMRRPADFRFIEQANRDLLAKDAANIAGARDDVEEQMTFLQFVRMADTDPAAFNALSDYAIRVGVSDSHAAALLSMRNKAGAPSGIQSPLRVLDRHMQKMGYGTAQQVAFSKAVEEMWAHAGGMDKISIPELTKILDNMSVEREISGTLDDKRAWEMTLQDVSIDDIPTDVYDDIHAVIRNELPYDATQPMVEQAIRARYLQGLRMGLFAPTDADG